MRTVFAQHVRWLDRQSIDRTEAERQIEGLFSSPEIQTAMKQILDNARDWNGSIAKLTSSPTTLTDEGSTFFERFGEIMRQHVRWLDQHEAETSKLARGAK